MKNFLILIAFVFSNYSLLLAQDTGYGVDVDQRINQSVIPEPLEGNINTKYREGKPLISSDGMKLFFSRSFHPDNYGGLNDAEDIWVSEFNVETGKWITPQNLGEPLNSAGPNFVSEVIGIGDTLILGNVYRKKKMLAGISISMNVAGKWSWPEEIHIDRNYNLSNRVSFDVSPGRDILIIAQEKDDTEGGTDLYISFRIYEGKHRYALTESVNMGPVLNSSENEITPKISNDGKGIYFASKGHNGYGGFDLFYSERLDNTWLKWSKPKNLGVGLNSKFDDEAPSLTKDGKWVYYSRGVSESNQDIYKASVEKLYSK